MGAWVRAGGPCQASRCGRVARRGSRASGKVWRGRRQQPLALSLARSLVAPPAGRAPDRVQTFMLSTPQRRPRRRRGTSRPKSEVRPAALIVSPTARCPAAPAAAHSPSSTSRLHEPERRTEASRTRGWEDGDVCGCARIPWWQACARVCECMCRAQMDL